MEHIFRIVDFNVYNGKDSLNESSDDEQNVYKDTNNFVIQMFGLNEEGETYSLFVSDFQPFFFVKVGNNWGQSTVNKLLSEIKQKLGKYYEQSIESAKLVEYNKLYGFSGGKLDKFAHFTFKNTSTMNKVKNMWYEYTEDGYRKSKSYIFEKTNLILYNYKTLTI